MSADRFTVPTDIANLVGSMMHEHANALSAIANGMMQSYIEVGVAEEHTPHLVIRNLIIVAAMLGFASAELEGRKPQRDLWTKACNETFDEAAMAFAKASGGVQ